jgi:hypothetical protein
MYLDRVAACLGLSPPFSYLTLARTAEDCTRERFNAMVAVVERDNLHAASKRSRHWVRSLHWAAYVSGAILRWSGKPTVEGIAAASSLASEALRQARRAQAMMASYGEFAGIERGPVSPTCLEASRCAEPALRVLEKNLVALRHARVVASRREAEQRFARMRANKLRREAFLALRRAEEASAAPGENADAAADKRGDQTQ